MEFPDIFKKKKPQKLNSTNLRHSGCQIRRISVTVGAKFDESPSQWVPNFSTRTDRQTEGQTDMKLKIAFRNFVKAPKI